MPVQNRLGVTLRSKGEDNRSVIASVDGYNGGWIIATAEGWQCGEPPRLIARQDFASVVKETEECKILVVDMPIGSPSGAKCRACDLDARKALGNSGQTRLFLCPHRKSLGAGSPVEFQASIKELTGKGAGLPVWGIVARIKEVDSVMTPELQFRVMEFHPELAWRRLADGGLASKHSAHGLLQRINLLNKHKSNWLVGLDTADLPSKVKLDDVLDSIVGLSVAHGIAEDPSYKNRFPKLDAPRDERGLRMEIWF